MADDLFRKHERKKSDPARAGGDYAAGVPGGDITFDPIPKAVYIGTTGVLVCVLADDPDGTTSTFTGALGFMPIAVRIVKAASTCGDIQPLREK